VISEVLQLDVSQTGEVAVTVVVPELTQSSVPTATPEAVEEADAFVTQEGYPRVSAWSLAMLFVLLGSGALYVIASRFTKRMIATRWSLGMLLGGLFVYNLMAFGFFDLPSWLLEAGISGVLYATLTGQLLGFAAGWAWSRLEK
ncbi:MAG TPA: hypothetical protein PKE23_12290, partial [Anaerolineales bacterium]|nr:hypothetical protein [Anaerolineales bacterium]